MIEETTRIKNNTLNEIVDEEPVQDPIVSNPQVSVSEIKINRLFIELLICSLLLWSLLFVKHSSYEKQVVQTINTVLDQQIQNKQIQEFVKQLEIVVEQIL